MKPEAINANIVGTIMAIKEDASGSSLAASEAWEYGITIAKVKISVDQETEFAMEVERNEKLEAACEVVLKEFLVRTKGGILIEPVDGTGNPVEHTTYGWDFE